MYNLKPNFIERIIIKNSDSELHSFVSFPPSLLNQHPTVHQAGWKVHGQETLFHCLHAPWTTVITYALTIPRYLVSMYLVITMCLAYLLTYLHSTHLHLGLTYLRYFLPTYRSNYLGSVRWK